MATAFAIYSETDNSLNFYKRDTTPVIGDTFNDRVVTKIYTDFETVAYTDSNHPNWQKDGKPTRFEWKNFLQWRY